MSTQLRASAAYHLGLITKKQEEWITLQCREKHRLECEKNGHIFNGGEMAEEGNLDGIKALIHYSPESAANNVGRDKCCLIPRNGPGSDCIIMLTVTFPKSCYYEKELQDNPDAEWPKETSDDVKKLAAGIVATDIWPSVLSKGDGTAKALKKAKQKFVDDMGFDTKLDGKKVKGTDIAEMMGMLQHIRQIVAMSKHTGKPVPTLAFGAVARDSLANNGKFQSDYVLGCGASHHMEGIIKACSRNEENIAESDSNMGTWYGHRGNNGEAFPMTFGMRRFKKKYLDGEYLDIHVLRAEAAMWMFEQTQHYGRTKEEALEAMPDELSVHHYLLYEACREGGSVTGDKRTEAALFMVEQIYVNKLSEETALDIMPDELSPAHRAIYEGCLKGKPVRLTSLDGNTVLATARSCRAAARMLGFGHTTIITCLQDGLVVYFGEELCQIEEIKGEEVDKFGKTSAFDPWLSNLQLEKLKTRYNLQMVGPKPVRLTSLDGNTVLATARSCRAAARMLGIGPDIITRCLDDGLLMYFEQELCLIEEIKGEEVDKFGKTSAFDPWLSNLQLENWSETRPVKTQYNLQKAAAGKKGAKKAADTRNKMLSDAQQLENMFIQANLLQYLDNTGCRLLLLPLLSESHVNILLGRRYLYNSPNHPPAEKTLVDIGEEIGAKIGEAVGLIASKRAHVTDEVGKSFGKKFGTDVGAAVGAQVEAEVKAKAFDGALAQIVSKVQTAVLAEVEQKVITAIRVAQEFQDLNKP